MIRITTVIPAYNSIKTIGETLNSVVAQTRKSDQIIVVDDGSNDNTRDIVNCYGDVQYFRQDNTGVSAARNRGMEAAEGEWIALCDSDDVWTPHKLAIIEACIKRFPQCDFFFHDFYLFGHNRTVKFRGEAEGPETPFPIFRENDISYKRMMQNHQAIELTGLPWSLIPLYQGRMFAWLILGNCILPSSIIFRKKVIDQCGGFDTEFRSAEDTEFFLRLAKKIDFAYIDLPLAGYRSPSGGLTGNIPLLLHNGMRALFKHAVDDPLIYSQHKKNINIAIARRYGRLASYYLRTRDREKSLRNLLCGIRYNCLEKQLWKVLLASLLPHSLLEFLVNARKGNSNSNSYSK